MPTFRYNPSPDEPEVIRTQGRTFQAGESFELDEKDPLLRKFRGHPQFEEKGAQDGEAADQQQAQVNAKARDNLEGKRKEVTETRNKAREALAKAEADERRIALSERALGTLSPAEQRAMEQVRGVAGDDGEPVPGEAGYRGRGTADDGTTGGGVVGNTGTGGALEPDNRARAEDRPQR